MLKKLLQRSGKEPQRDLEGYRQKLQKREQQRRHQLMARRQRAEEVAKEAAQFLYIKYGVTQVVLFGSVLTSDFHEASDIDLAVWGIPPEHYFSAVGWLQGLSEFEIDLVEASNASEYLQLAISAGRVL